MTMMISRRDTLRAAGSLPLLFAAGTAGAAAGTDESPALAFATAQAERLSAPLQTVQGKLPSELAGTLWRNGPAEHDRFGHRYGHWFDGDGMIQAFPVRRRDRHPPGAHPGHAQAPPPKRKPGGACCPLSARCRPTRRKPAAPTT